MRLRSYVREGGREICHAEGRPAVAGNSKLEEVLPKPIAPWGWRSYSLDCTRRSFAGAPRTSGVAVELTINHFLNDHGYGNICGKN